VLHVVPPPFAIYTGTLAPPIPLSNQGPLQEQLKALAAKHPDIRIEPCLAEGETAAEILSVAKDMCCDMIVLGTHGRRGFGRLLLGSVAEQVMRKASCPVVTAKAPRHGCAQEPIAPIVEREMVAAK
jgi:nucleotide-binding universal stress UspA family protein